MNLIAIDFGTERTKIAFLDPRTKQPELVRIGEDVPYWPSLFHISSVGNVSVGDDANKLREDSPGGVVDDLKRRFRDTAIRRNRQKKTKKEILGIRKSYIWIINWYVHVTLQDTLKIGE